MPFHVQGEMVGSGETAFADLAAERFGARVFPIVTGQLVGAGETPLTLWPVAAVRFLTCQQQNALCRDYRLGLHFVKTCSTSINELPYMQTKTKTRKFKRKSEKNDDEAE